MSIHQIEISGRQLEVDAEYVEYFAGDSEQPMEPGGYAIAFVYEGGREVYDELSRDEVDAIELALEG